MKGVMIGKAELTTSDVIELLERSGKPLREWGTAEDGSPILAAFREGKKQPAIFITAGAHSSETAGIHASLNLLEQLETDHEVHILPLRDPMGFAGVQHCLAMALGQPVQVQSHAEVLAFLTEHAELLEQKGEIELFLLGDVGFVWCPHLPGLEPYWQMTNWMGDLVQSQPEVVNKLAGKSVMLIDPCPDVEGAYSMQRCWHAFVRRDGAWLHLNRMLGEIDAPPEVAAVNNLMQTIKPGLTCDLHEGNGSGFWLPIPKPEYNSEHPFLMAKAFFDYIQRCGYPVTEYAEWLASDRTPLTAQNPDWMMPEPRLPGFFWVDTLKREEGHNLSTYAGIFGLGFGTEGPMSRSLRMRIDGITNGILAAIRVWEQITDNYT